MWENEEDEIIIPEGESCFREGDALVSEEEIDTKKQQDALMLQIVKAQAKLKELRIKEAEQDEKLRVLKSDMHRAREKTLVGQDFIIEVGFLIDSEENMQWLKKKSQDIIDSLTSLKRDRHVVRCGVVYYNQKAGASDCKLLQFTEDFNKLTQEFPHAPRDPSTLSLQRTGLKGAIGEAINLLQWQGSARILLHPSPSSNIRKGQDPPTSQSNHFFRFGTNNDINVELQRSVLALRALYIDYFIIKTGKIDASPRQKKGDGSFSAAIANYFDDPDSFLECRFIKIEEAINIKKAILSCIGMAMRN